MVIFADFLASSWVHEFGGFNKMKIENVGHKTNKRSILISIDVLSFHSIVSFIFIFCFLFFNSDRKYFRSHHHLLKKSFTSPVFLICFFYIPKLSSHM
jgi:hypothetical protein